MSVDSVISQGTGALLGNSPAPDKVNQTAEAALADAYIRAGMNPAEAVAKADGVIQGIIKQSGATREAAAQAILQEVQIRTVKAQRDIDAAYGLTQSQYAIQQQGASGETNIAIGYRNQANSGGMMWTGIASFLDILPEGLKTSQFGEIIKQIGQFFHVDDIWKSAHDTVEARKNTQVSDISSERLEYKGLKEFKLSVPDLDNIATSVRRNMSIKPDQASSAPNAETAASPSSSGQFDRKSFSSSLDQSMRGTEGNVVKASEAIVLNKAFEGIAAKGGAPNLIDSLAERASLAATIRLNVASPDAERKLLAQTGLLGPTPNAAVGG